MTAAFLALVPFQAMGQDGADNCENLASLMQGIGTFGKIELAEVRDTNRADGWCAVSAALFLGRDVRFEKALFRGEQLSTAGLGSGSLEIRLTELHTDIGVFDVAASFSHNVQSGALVLHELTARGSDGRGVKASAQLSRKVAVDTETVQAAFPDIALSNLSAKIFVTPALLAALDINFPDVTRTALNSALRDVSEMQVSSRSRRAFLGFSGAAPNAWGTVEIEFAALSETSVLQLIGPFLNLGHGRDDDAIARAFDVALSGVMLDVTWKPGRM